MGSGGCAASSDGARRRQLDAVHNLLQLLPADSTVPAISSVDGRAPLLHVQLARFLGNDLACCLWEQLCMAGVQSLQAEARRAIVGLVLPNGPELGVALLGVMAWATCVPVNADAPHEEVAADLRAAGAEVAIIMDPGTDDHIQGKKAGSLISALAQANMAVLQLVPRDAGTPAGLFGLKLVSTPHDMPIQGGAATLQICCKRDDVVLLLHTSGTSGAKKLVPYTLDMLAEGAACVARPWALSPADVCLNMMLLSHAGGIVRNLLAPLMAGGGVLLAPAFDARQFWDLLLLRSNTMPPGQGGSSAGASSSGSSSRGCALTWYYAAPTMHAMILQEYDRRTAAAQAKGSSSSALRVAALRVRLVANAAGPLLPSLAVRLKDVFRSAAVLPCYGLTECMPVATPPLDYALDRPGTSGRAVGPQLAILDRGTGTRLRPGATGAICVRGPPTFSGYYCSAPAAAPSRPGPVAPPGTGTGESKGGADGKAAAVALLPGGWFDTGDLGWMDEEGWLYVTGRGKEVINRGGEIVAPAEVEEALASQPQLESCLAFSVAHEVLQEVVGVAVVVARGAARPSLGQLHNHLAGRLHPSKWPQLLVFMDRLPHTASNKLQRVGLAKRLSLPCIDDATPAVSRLFEATAPPPSAPCGLTPIPCAPVDVQAEAAAAAQKLLSLEVVADVACVVERGGVAVYVQPAAGASAPPLDALRQHLNGSVSSYALPTCVVAVPYIPRTADGQLRVDCLARADASVACQRTAAQELVCSVWAQVLGMDPGGILADDNFFTLGGSSMAVGEATALLRKQFGQPLLQAATLYQHPTLADLAAALEKGKPKGTDDNGAGPLPKLSWLPSPSFGDRYSSTRPLALLLQALPLLVFYPAKRVSIVMLFAAMLAVVRNLAGSVVESCGAASVVQVVLAAVLVSVVADVVKPFLGIAIKWLLAGRYRPGAYPLWGGCYLRRQLVQQITRMLGLGVFAIHPGLVAVYHRLMGAEIGRGVRIHKACEISEWDLVAIGEGSALDRCVVRPFALAPGRMLLEPIHLGRGCCVCMKSVVAPGASLGDGASIGPLSSSHEAASDAASLEAARRVCRVLFPEPHPAMLLFAAWPLIAVAALIGAAPQLALLYALVTRSGLGQQATTVQSVLLWLSAPQRYPWALALALVRALVCPFASMGAAIFIKRCVLGRNQEGAFAASQLSLLRNYVMATLLPGGALLGVPQLLSPNVSQGWLLRALGAKVGKRIFWPGSGIDVVEYDLLEIGDDVVFGSRSAILCSDAHRAARVVIGAGSMVADRCVLMPGATVGRGAVVGSGTLLPTSFHAPPGSCWLGSRAGGPVPWTAAARVGGSIGSKHGVAGHLGVEGAEFAVETEETLTPFGRGFHLKRAPYWVWPMWLHICYNMLARAAAALMWTVPLLATLTAVRRSHVGIMYLSRHCDGGCIWHVWLAALPYASMFFGAQCIAVLSLTAAAQQAIIGSRQPGSYDWDESDYQQRWQLSKAVQSLRMRLGAGQLHGLLDFLHGSVYLVWYFRALGARIGREVCLYPNGADPMMTEPDLVELGRGAAVDDASLVAHLNTKGHFTLNRLQLGEGAVVRTGSRLLSGASMEPNSALLEHTLVVSGDAVPMWTAWQGWPAHGVRQLLQKVALADDDSSEEHSKALPNSNAGDAVIELGSLLTASSNRLLADPCFVPRYKVEPAAV